MPELLDTFVTIIFVCVALFMVLSILLQSGRGGGLGAALGGGSSQGVFGGGGGADFVSRLTQIFAALFMISAMYLAYSSAHAGSDFLKGKSEELELEARQVDDDTAVNYETVGPNPLQLPTADQAKARREAMEPLTSEPIPTDPAGQDDPVGQDDSDGQDGSGETNTTGADETDEPNEADAESGPGEPDPEEDSSDTDQVG